VSTNLKSLSNLKPTLLSTWARLGRWRFAAAAPVLGVVVLVIVWAVSPGQASDPAVPLYKVTRGPLTVSVTESGTIKSREQVVVKNEVEGQTRILWLIPEGAVVNASDLLMELDSSALVEERTKQHLAVLSAESAWVGAREGLEVTISESQSKVAEAQLKQTFAQLDLDKYLKGEYPQQLDEANTAITLATEDVNRAKEKLDWSTRLAAEKYITQLELKADELAYMRAQLDLSMEQGKRRVLQEYTNNRETASLRSDIDQTEAALKRAKLTAAADITQARAERTAKESEFQRQQAQLEKIDGQIIKCRLFAPVGGTVVYATTGQPPWRGHGPLEEGRELREREELIYLPTAQAMNCQVKIHEASMPKVRQGLPVRITIDAVPGKVFTGWVEKISFIPDAQSSWLNPDLKVYNTEVFIDGNSTELRPGMSCQAEVIFEQYGDVMYVPISAVVRIHNQPTVYVMTSDGPKPQSVEVGLDNNRMIVITSGLKPGQKVLLAPPLPDTSDEREKLAPVPASAPAPRAAQTQPASRPSSQADAAAGTTGSLDGPGGPTSRPTSAPDPAAIQAALKEVGLTREAWDKMTPEEKLAKIESLTPEQRQALRPLFRRGGGTGGGQGGPGRGDGQGGGRGEGRRSRQGAAPGGPPVGR
jgi:HlyD family secretion protein